LLRSDKSQNHIYHHLLSKIALNIALLAVQFARRPDLQGLAAIRQCPDYPVFVAHWLSNRCKPFQQAFGPLPQASGLATRKSFLLNYEEDVVD
jgi:hypothetical protein